MMRRIASVLPSVLLIGLLLTAWPGQALAVAQGDQGLQDGWAIDDAGHALFTDEVAAKMAEAGAGWVRINFRLGGFQNWTETTTFGYSALELYDDVVDNALENNLAVLGLLSNESWRGQQSDWQANNAERDGGNGDNAYLSSFSLEAAVILASHFSGRVDLWEVWNEPNAYTSYSEAEGYTGSSFIYPSNFAWLLRHVYEDVKEAGITDARFVSGGVFGHDLGGLATFAKGRQVVKRGDPVLPYYGLRLDPSSQMLPAPNAVRPASVPESGSEYISATYDQGLANAGWDSLKATYGSYPLDGVGQHLYIDQGSTTSARNISTYLGDIRKAYSAYEGKKTAKQTHVTEVGWATDRVSEIVQAENLEIAYGEFKDTSYVQRAHWFQLRDIPGAIPSLYYGLLTPFDQPWTEKPSWLAYQITAGAGGDNAPSVAVRSPGDGDTVSGTVTVTADATDDNGVTQVDFLVDGISIGVDSSSVDGWSITWDTTTVADGDHAVTAEATDTVGQKASDSITVRVSNSVGPAVDSITPNSMPAGSTADVEIKGSGFVSGAEITFEGGVWFAPGVSDSVVVDGNTITATLTTKIGRLPRDRIWDVRITNPDGSSAVLIDGFTVTA